MDSLETLVRALPGQADRIRRRFWRDAEFRAVCEDYRDVVGALAKLEGGQPTEAAPADELRGLAADLLVEAEAMLRGEEK